MCVLTNDQHPLHGMKKAYILPIMDDKPMDSPWTWPGLQISQNPKGIFVNQAKYAIEMLKKYGLDQCDVVDIPMVERSKLDEEPNGILVDPTRYQSMVGSLMSFDTSKEPLIWDFGIRKDTGFDLTAFADANHLTDYGFDYNKIPFYYDSKSVIALSGNTVQHSRTKHIAVRYHFVKEQVENEIFELSNVKTAYQLADIFTKALARDCFEFLINRLGMQSITLEELKHLAELDEE
ncbi:hypothetical protein Tco_0550868 [Tanacetum coccineum]